MAGDASCPENSSGGVHPGGEGYCARNGRRETVPAGDAPRETLLKSMLPMPRGNFLLRYTMKESRPLYTGGLV